MKNALRRIGTPCLVAWFAWVAPVPVMAGAKPSPPPSTRSPDAPAISDLKILAIESHEAHVQFTVQVTDPSGDLNLLDFMGSKEGSPVESMIVCKDGLYRRSGKADKIEGNEPTKRGVVHVDMWQIGATAHGKCDLTIALRDKPGHQSNELKAVVEFK